MTGKMAYLWRYLILMKINKVIELPDGAVEITANLNQAQVEFLIEIGLNIVLAKGAKPFIDKNDFTIEQLQNGTSTVQ